MAGKQHWKPTKTQYLCRLGEWYYVRVRVGKDIIRESLKTKVKRVFPQFHFICLLLRWMGLLKREEVIRVQMNKSQREKNTTRLCEHLSDLTEGDFPPPRTPNVCEDCLKEGTQWVHLRECLICGHVGCCDSSPRRHATAHFHETHHPVMRSVEPGEYWTWCYVHKVTGQLAREPVAAGRKPHST